MAMQNFMRTKAQALQKVADLPRFRHPADLLNAFTHPFDSQKNQLEGTLPFQNNQYISLNHEKLIRSIIESRKAYRLTTSVQQRENYAKQQYFNWNNYLNSELEELRKGQFAINKIQAQQIYEAMIVSKQRGEERLALCRFIKFGYEYSQGFKVDFALHPEVMMRMVHPHFGYLNAIPNLTQYKYTHQQVIDLIENFIVASQFRQQGYSLHSSEMVSLIFWKIINSNQPRLNVQKAIDFLKIFKFDINEQNFEKTFEYTLKEGEWTKDDQNIRFDFFRQLFLERNL